jgi:hypothetical protein
MRLSSQFGLRFAVGAALMATIGCGVAADEDVDAAEGAASVNASKRAEAVAKAQVFDAEDFAKLASKDLARGPDYEGRPNGDTVVCQFVEAQEDLDDNGQPKTVGGKTAKFKCGPITVPESERPADMKPATLSKITKVKYSGKGRLLAEHDDPTQRARAAIWHLEDGWAGHKGPDGQVTKDLVNGEVFAEAIGTRVMWALGFHADGIYPTKVICYGCSEKPFGQTKREKTADGKLVARHFFWGAIEIKHPGKAIEEEGVADDQQGFNLVDDLNKIDAAKGGATKEQLDAWKLLAAFIVHGDNKKANNRLMCKTKLAPDGSCAESFAMFQDVGVSFGSSGFFGYKKAELNAWRGSKVWEDPRTFRMSLDGTLHTQLKSQALSKQGCQFLGDKLKALSDEQLTAIFEGSRVAFRGETIKDGGTERQTTTADWVATFRSKRDEILKACPLP